MSRGGGLAGLAASLRPGTTAFLDADWLAAPMNTRVPALVSGPGAVISFGAAEAPLPAGMTGEGAAGVSLLAVAEEAVQALTSFEPSRIEVYGIGLVAHLVRRIVGCPDRGRATDRPAAIVDTTGLARQIAGAMKRLDDLGTLVLAGPSVELPLPLDLYWDVHRRGLRLVGVAPPLGDGRSPVELSFRGGEDQVEPPAALGPSGAPSRAHWYRLPAG